MNLDEMKTVIPADWLDQHRLEYIELSEKITRTIMMAEAANKGWKEPLTKLSDFEAFIASEAADKEMSAENIRLFLMDAGKIRARNNIFEKYCVPLLPKDDQGKCTATKKVILDFIRFTVEEK
ncbi:MAG: hypothetical protein HN580_03025 [Deltaproteobacteria bacterium]|jgi:hypothetical protein|nr:hypothetical protein [Deltaproteobacteria bacterium]MBT4267075.1 hypothetical protein [Deltaproteobacteria bacterium]MBT4638017.1 hypothetical protein [Deltaproteobacteria bacterium]MBT6501067.1 hypothetical protein [Deltaproteobacteria bacterium]MBT7155960.1 hypothetical protein [Deltaproteobacteria bacterium]